MDTPEPVTGATPSKTRLDRRGGMAQISFTPSLFGVAPVPNYPCGKAALAFTLSTAANLIPRALWRHRWYRRTFPAYPERISV